MTNPVDAGKQCIHMPSCWHQRTSKAVLKPLCQDLGACDTNQREIALTSEILHTIFAICHGSSPECCHPSQGVHCGRDPIAGSLPEV